MRFLMCTSVITWKRNLIKWCGMQWNLTLAALNFTASFISCPILWPKLPDAPHPVLICAQLQYSLYFWAAHWISFSLSKKRPSPFSSSPEQCCRQGFMIIESTLKERFSLYGYSLINLLTVLSPHLCTAMCYSSENCVNLWLFLKTNRMIPVDIFCPEVLCDLYACVFGRQIFLLPKRLLSLLQNFCLGNGQVWLRSVFSCCLKKRLRLPP